MEGHVVEATSIAAHPNEKPQSIEEKGGGRHKSKEDVIESSG